MSENTHRFKRRLYVTNRGSGSELSDEDLTKNMNGHPASGHSSRPYGTTSTHTYSGLKSSHATSQPSIVTIDLPVSSSQYHSSHPPLSSPSSTSSRAAGESTPPPTTPGMTVPPVDISGASASAPEPIIPHNNDRGLNDVPQSSTTRTGKPLPPAKPVYGTRGPRPAEPAARRSRTSPTLSTPDAYSSNLSSNSYTPIGERVLIVVTSDSERYVTVDVSGAPNPDYIRECIFTKLNIFDEDEQAQYSIFQTEIGENTMGKPLTVEKLFLLCRDRGDFRGSLKFFVTHTPSSEGERSPRTPPVIPPQQSFSTIPPVLPTHAPIPPLRLNKRKPRSRHDSVSSFISEHPNDSAAGYEADLDNPEKESHRTTLRPSQQSFMNSNVGSPPASPHHRRLNGSALPQPSQSPQDLPRSLSPPVTSLHQPPPPPPTASQQTFTDIYGQVLPTPPPPPPLSPVKPKFPINDDSTLLPPGHARQHARSGSDAAAEREQAIIASEQQLEEVSRWKTARPTPIRPVLRTEPSRDILQDNRQPRKRVPTDHEDRPYGSPSAHSFDPSPSTSSLLNERVANRISPSVVRKQPLNAASPRGRPISPYTHRPPIPPPPRTQPPSLPPPSNDARILPRSNVSGNRVPQEFYVRWKGEVKSPHHFSRTSTKSMDNLRTSLPTGRRAGALPVSRPSGFSPSGLGGTPKSFDPSRLPINATRPSPQYNGSESTVSPQQNYLRNNMPYSNTNSSISSSLVDPYPRPSSAAGDSVISPRYGGRPSHSPTYGSTLDPNDLARSPRATSPSRTYQHPDGPRPRPSTSDRAVDSYNSGFETTPPRSPVTPQSPRRDNEGFKIVDDTSPRTYGPDRASDATLRQEDLPRFMQAIRAIEGESTLMAPRIDTGQSYGGKTTISITTTAASSPPSRMPSPAPPSTTNSQIYDMYDGFSSDAASGNGTWIIKPRIDEKPKLKVQIEDQNKQSPSSEKSTVTLMVPPSLADLRAGSSTSGSRVGGTYEMPHNERDKRREREWEREVGREQGTNSSTFSDSQDGWALRPPPEAVYEHLEHYFRNHDLDKPVIEATSGETSPTSTESATTPSTVIASSSEKEKDKGKFRTKKSIRYVAEDAKRRIDRTSKAESIYASTYLKKRNTKFWGGKLEEVTTHQAKSGSGSSGSSQPDSPSRATTTFKWVRGEPIGRGTYGRVYLAMNATTGEMIAVKQVELPRTASDKYDPRQQTVVDALKSESETLKDLDHPNIVQYLGFEETADNLSIFLEYVPGGSVGSCLHKHGRFNENVTKSFTSQILDGLEYLHERGILHRDLKADNILVEMSGVCKISDFGISKRTDGMAGGAFTAMQGTVFWMAPEVIKSKEGKGYNNKIDIWSVGCVVLEMWAGMRPWTGEEMVAVMFKLYQNKLPPPVPKDVHLSPLADDFRQRCFAIDPDDRPSAAVLRKHEYLVLPPDWQFTTFT